MFRDSDLQQQMENIQKRPAPTLNAQASHVTLKKGVMILAWMPYILAVACMAATTMADDAVAMADAQMMAVVARPETM